jgi:hypothetical protein
VRERVEKAVSTGDNKKWDPVIGELLNPNYQRQDAIKVLVDFLRSPDWSVRIRSAQELLDLGSRDGVPIPTGVAGQGGAGGLQAVAGRKMGSGFWGVLVMR